MNTKDVAIMKAVAVVVREYVSQVGHDIAARLKALETQPAPRDGAPGPTGEKGLDGASGSQGEPGPVGPPGEQGARGERGEPGQAGIDGEKGVQGLQGERGLEGLPGRDGRDGLSGVQGEKGLDGKDGAHGLNGNDGRDGTLDGNIKIVRLDERTVSLCFKNGDPIEGGIVKFDVPLYRGVYVNGKAYEASDMVTWAGSTWYAREATTDKPGDGSTAWVLTVKRGRDGRDGVDAPGAMPVVSVGKPR